MEVRIVAPTAAHADELAWSMRRAERAEVRAQGYEPRVAIGVSLDASVEAWTVLVDERVLAMFGVIPVAAMLGHGNLWLLASNSVGAHKITYARLCRRILSDLLVRWPILTVQVDREYTAALLWAKRCGFRSVAQIENEITGLPFVQMMKVA